MGLEDSGDIQPSDDVTFYSIALVLLTGDVGWGCACLTSRSRRPWWLPCTVESALPPSPVGNPAQSLQGAQSPRQIVLVLSPAILGWELGCFRAGQSKGTRKGPHSGEVWSGTASPLPFFKVPLRPGPPLWCLLDTTFLSLLLWQLSLPRNSRKFTGEDLGFVLKHLSSCHSSSGFS